jgi:hypothetical protein
MGDLQGSKQHNEREQMKTYSILGNSYEKGYYVALGTIQAKTHLGALRLARKLFDKDKGITGYSDFIAREVN